VDRDLHQIADVRTTVPTVTPMPRTRMSPLLTSPRPAASSAFTRTVPGATPVSRPVPLMVATLGSVVDQLTGLVTPR